MGAKTIAIACQGGGSHTAFTAGVLKRLLPSIEGRFRLAGLSGASGGAICAALAWRGLLTGAPGRAGELLDAFWSDVAAAPWEWPLNAWLVWANRLRGLVPMLELSPYALPATGQDRLRAAIARALERAGPPTIPPARQPTLLVSAINVKSGKFTLFRDADVGVDVLLSSAAVPTLFRAVSVAGQLYWDGLLSQNPPIREFVSGVPDEAKPDEIWIIQIDPQTRTTEPKTTLEIEDRRNELAGNLSLNQEVAFIEKVNEWRKAGHIDAQVFKHIEVRWLPLERALDAASKLDRSPDFIAELMQLGARAAAHFLSNVEA